MQKERVDFLISALKYCKKMKKIWFPMPHEKSPREEKPIGQQKKSFVDAHIGYEPTERVVVWFELYFDEKATHNIFNQERDCLTKVVHKVRRDEKQNTSAKDGIGSQTTSDGCKHMCDHFE
jgi:hypothetical protein